MTAFHHEMKSERRTDAAGLVELRYLDELRRRVAWQADAAAVLRARAARAPRAPVDPLALPDLFRIVESRPHAARAPEWRSFLAELQFLGDAEGRLPSSLERLVRVVFADLLD
jgi:hypothetical protein